MKVVNDLKLMKNYRIYQAVAQQKKRRFMEGRVTKLPTSLASQCGHNLEKISATANDSKKAKVVAGGGQQSDGDYTIKLVCNKNELIRDVLQALEVIIVFADYERLGFCLIANLFRISAESKIFYS